MITLITENCEEYDFPRADYFGIANDNKSLLIKIDVNKTMFYTPENILRLSSQPDITRIVYNGREYECVYKEAGDRNGAEGIYFYANYLFIAIGDKKALTELLEEEGFNAKDEEAFEYAIGFIPESLKPESKERPKDHIATEPLTCTVVVQDEKPHKSSDTNKELKAIALLLAKHYSLMDKPRSGWIYGDPYQSIVEELH